MVDNLRNKWLGMLLTIVFAYFSAIATIAFAGTGADRIDLRYPPVAENPGMVPVGVTLDPPLSPGQTLNIYSNGQLAISMKASGVSIKKFNSGVRMAGNGMIEVQLLDQKGKILASRSVEPKPGIPLEESPVPTSRRPPPDPYLKAEKLNVRKRGNEGFRVRVMVEHALKLGQVGYIDFKSSTGTVSASLTAYSIPRLYWNFTMEQDPGKFEVSTRIE